MRESAIRIAIACGVAIPTCAAVIGLLLVLPSWCSLATMFAGLACFLVGRHLGLRWPLVIGGVAMFGGVFAAAVLGALH